MNNSNEPFWFPPASYILLSSALPDPGELTEVETKAPESEKTPKYRCNHGRNKYACKDCGKGYCEHKRAKHTCKDCGKGYCHHGHLKSKCRSCGTGICEHGRWKHRCRDCGTGICEHEKWKHACAKCRARKAFLKEALSTESNEVETTPETPLVDEWTFELPRVSGGDLPNFP